MEAKSYIMFLLFMSALHPTMSVADNNLSVKSKNKDSRFIECINTAANHFRISPKLIQAIIKTESNFKPEAINTDTPNNEDLGLMQISSYWHPKILAAGYDRESLFEPCANIMVGSWILAQEIERFGYTWTAVGAYNAGPSPEKESRRIRYAKRVFSNLSD